MREDEIARILDQDPITGWTAANVIKRFTHTQSSLMEEDLRQLRAYFEARCGDGILDSTIRWRVVHALGSFDTPANASLLFHALDTDTYHWTRYGAARSLMEIAASTKEPGLRARIVAGLTDRLAALPPKILSQIARVANHRDAPPTWKDDLRPLLDAARKLEKRDPTRESWTPRLVQTLENICEQTPPQTTPLISR